MKITMDVSAVDFNDFTIYLCRPNESVADAIFRIAKLEVMTKKLQKELRDKK
jgi:hypothetical protein